MRSALRLVLDNEPGMSIAGDCVAAHGLVEQVVASGADVVVLDWDLPGLHASGALAALRAEQPGCRVLVLSGRPEQRAEALRAGVVTFVSKGDAPETLLRALRALADLDAQTHTDQPPQPDRTPQSDGHL